MRILIIRPGAIGDTLLTLPVMQALRARYQAAHITLVGNVAVLPLALASGIVDAVADYGQLQWSELFSSIGIYTPAMLSLLQQTDLVICWLRDSDGVVRHNLQQAGVKHLVIATGHPPEGQRIHIIRYLMETVGLPLDTIDTIELTRWQLPLKQQDGLLDEGKQPLVAIHPGSGGARKCWPVTAFAEVIERLWQRGYSVLLLAGPADFERINYLRQHLASPPEQTMLTVLVDAPFLEVAQHLRQCQRYLGNDAGITHLAAMLGIPTVALFGPSDPSVWRPVGPDVEVIHVAELAQLPVEVVINALC
ncbi:MAG: glycosyltransferase family 9 protein [Ktedonobacteraceae bacterium]